MTGRTEPLLSVREASLGFGIDGKLFVATKGVGFDVRTGEALGLVGESGCGKSITLRSLVGLQSPAHILEGQAMFEGEDLFTAGRRSLQRIRAARIGMIFQDPGRSLDPVMTVGAQIGEILRVRARMGRAEARREALDLLDRVGIPDPTRRYQSYPHEMSGGMRQRVTIAMAIALKPALILADEPTTALDVTIQDQILALLGDLQREMRTAMILVSHDLGVIAETCDNVAVMYAGRVVEYGSVAAVLRAPRHPYTRALLAALPTPEAALEQTRLSAISGQPPELGGDPAGCPFQPRCPVALAECLTTQPIWIDPDPGGQRCACLRVQNGSRLGA